MAFYIKKDDTSPALRATMTDGENNAINITDATVVFRMYTLDGVEKVNSSCSIIDGAAGIVEYVWQAGDTDTTGTFRGEWQVTYTDSTIEKFPNNDYASIVVVADLD